VPEGLKKPREVTRSSFDDTAAVDHHPAESTFDDEDKVNHHPTGF
jgi:hypothetical protein